MTAKTNFQPKYGSTQSITPAAASAPITIGAGNRVLRVKNTGATNPMQFRTGKASDGTVTATAADMPVYPGEVVYIEKPADHDTVATISAAGTTAVVTAGEGGVGSGN
jgi:hypothetical protein